MDTFADDLNDALLDVDDEFAEFQELLNEGATKTALKRAFSGQDIRQCMSCQYHGRNLSNLKMHIRQRKHVYGVDRLAAKKADFVCRLLETHTGLEGKGIQLFCDVHDFYQEFEDWAKHEYNRLLLLSMQQIHLKR